MLQVTAIIAIALISYSYGSTEICEQTVRYACPPPNIQSSNEWVVPDVSFLDETCGSILQLTKCSVDFNETCRLRDTTSGITLQEIHDAASELCDGESEIGRAYRENVDCVNDKGDEYLAARSAYENEIWQFSLYLANHVEDYEHVNYENAVNCIGVQIADKHMRKFLEDACGEGAVKVLERVERVYLDHCPSPQSMLRFRVLYEQFLEERENIIQA